ncbi:type II toxin-antitoxin system RelE/ParE family toxin [Bradyrhizobium sp. 147]|nr:type II toxin-antitoxin system RelE/ParE family toxin [Bradyrhizobium sp. 147]
MSRTSVTAGYANPLDVQKNVVYKLQAVDLKQTETFRKWRSRLRDERARAVIASRLDRLAQGHAGDVEPVGDGVSELRIHYGPGYRIYFQKRGNTIIVLLCGGDKSTQAKDIKAAKRLAEMWSE